MQHSPTPLLLCVKLGWSALVVASERCPLSPLRPSWPPAQIAHTHPMGNEIEFTLEGKGLKGEPAGRPPHLPHTREAQAMVPCRRGAAPSRGPRPRCGSLASALLALKPGPPATKTRLAAPGIPPQAA